MVGRDLAYTPRLLSVSRGGDVGLEGGIGRIRAEAGEHGSLVEVALAASGVVAADSEDDTSYLLHGLITIRTRPVPRSREGCHRRIATLEYKGATRLTLLVVLHERRSERVFERNAVRILPISSRPVPGIDTALKVRTEPGATSGTGDPDRLGGELNRIHGAYTTGHVVCGGISVVEAA